MKSSFLRIFAFPVGAVLFISAAGAVSLSVTNKPYGVPDERREEYDQIVHDIRSAEAVLTGQVPTENLPFAVISDSTHDFGMIDPHVTATHAFEIRNTGKGPLKLDVAGTSCKCTLGRLGSGMLLPGEKTEITMEWNTGYQVDEYEQTATIQTNDPLHKEIELKVKGVVRAELIAPESVFLVSEKLGELAAGHFVLFSQLWDEFTIMSVTSEEEAGILWDVVPIDNDDVELADKQSKSAVRVELSLPRHQYGEFQGRLNIVIRPGDGSPNITREVSYSGKVRPPISFISPMLHMHEGLHIGVLDAGEEKTWNLFVRVRGAEGQKIEVLDVEPKELKAFIEPTQRENDYRLTLKIEKDCPMVIFNLDHQRGYVQVGDPDDKTFSNWFPVIGAVVEITD